VPAPPIDKTDVKAERKVERKAGRLSRPDPGLPKLTRPAPAVVRKLVPSTAGSPTSIELPEAPATP